VRLDIKPTYTLNTIADNSQNLFGFGVPLFFVTTVALTASLRAMAMPVVANIGAQESIVLFASLSSENATIILENYGGTGSLSSGGLFRSLVVYLTVPPLGTERLSVREFGTLEPGSLK
jgi:hypothetical protein